MQKKLIWICVIAALLVGLTIIGMNFNKHTSTPAATNAKISVGPANVIIVAFDGLQAKHLKEYGYTRDTTPNLDAFLDTSYIFKQAVSPSSWTVPSFMSIFTSLYPSEHKVVNKFVAYEGPTSPLSVKANLKALNPAAVTLAQVLQQNGYQTGGFTGDAGISAVFGDNQGFDTYYDKVQFGGFDSSIPQALDWLKVHKDKKFFMFVHGYDVHGQYAPPGGFDYRYVNKPYTGKYTGSPAEQGQLREKGLAGQDLGLSQTDIDFWRAIYDEKINRADAQFASFMDQVKQLGALDNTLVVVLSDHGTEFYEHKKFDHGHTLYGELTDVLLAIHLPGQKQGKSITDLVSTLDVAPTVTGLLGLTPPASGQWKGVDLSPAFNGTRVAHDVFSETDYRMYTHKRSVQTTDGWKFIETMETGTKELYNLHTDPEEQTNVVTSEPKKAYELEQQVLKHLTAMNSTGPWTIGCLPVYNDQCQKTGQ